MRRNSRTNRCSASGWIRRGHIRIGSMINIEQRCLCAFEQDLFLLFASLGKKMRSFRDERSQTLDQWRDLVVDVVSIEWRLTIKHDNPVGFFQVSLDPHSKSFGRKSI